MKKYIYATLVAGTALFFTGCSDDLEQVSIKRTGEEILFGGRAGFEMTGDAANSKTRTVYTGNIWEAENEAGEMKTYEGVNWVKDDKVRIFCQNAAGTQVADYTVSATNEEAIEGTEEHEVYLEKIGNVGLQWSDATDYEFFAVYPSPQQYPLNSNDEPDADYANNVLNGGTSVKGKIPSVQSFRRLEASGGNYILHPRMEYAYMVARQQVSISDKSDVINLNFVPIATAVEIELKNVSNRELELTNVLVASADNSPIFGGFTAYLDKLTDGNGDKSFTGVPTKEFVEVEEDETYGSQITIPTYDGEGGLVGNPIVLANNATLKFTVFMLPTQNVGDLKITLVGIEGNRMGTTSGVTIAQHKKTYLKQMPISVKQGDFDLSKWVEYLPDAALMHGLSIPGAGGASSGHTTNWDTNKLFLEQSLTIDQLWAQGIRCFEFTVDYADSYNTDGVPTTDGNLGNNVVYCNSISTGVTLADAVKTVKDKLTANPKEFAMVIITYQQQSGWNVRQDDGSVAQTRVPATFMEELNDFWDGVKAGTNTITGTWPEVDTEPNKEYDDKRDIIKTATALYKSDLTVADARGKLYCIARPTSNGEDNFAEVSTTYHGGLFGIGAYYELVSTTYSKYAPDTPSVTNADILVIHGWGALKDKWYARGFTDCIYKRGVGNGHFKAAEALDSTTRKTLLGYTINSNRPGRPFDVANESGNNYSTLPNAAGGYGEKTTDLALSNNVNFYYSTIHANSGGLQSQAAWVQEWARVVNESTTFTIESRQYARWISSIDEKKQHISDCLDYALKSTKGNIVYINSLCGYFVSNDDVNSARPNSLTDCNIANQYENTYSGNWKFNRLTGASSIAGMCGNIEGFATTINSYFYDLLQNTTTNPDFEPGPMGIILMDRISSDKNDNGSKIPSIIIANNFQYTLPSTTSLLMPTDEYDQQNDGGPAAKTRSNESKGGFTITWE